MKICLVVDDSEVIRKVARHILSDLHFAAIEAANGQDALERCRAEMPDAILLDWHMPVMNGIDFIAAVREEEGGDEPQIFYCTTENDPKDIMKALSVGADEYILKPFERAEIAKKFAEAGLM